MTSDRITAENQRMQDPDPWRRWGPYLAERAWGTVREDYSDNGNAWRSFTFDQARSRAYRWNEDGLGGISDQRQLLCFAWAFWNENDHILKERVFGLDGHEGNHGEDAKEYWWFPDALPSHAWMTFRYAYPIEAYPYEELREVNDARTKEDPEYELADTGVLRAGWWDILVEYAKHLPNDIGVRITVTNRSSRRATLHALPTLWFRNTWSWTDEATAPRITGNTGRIRANHPDLGMMQLTGPGGILVCDNETNSALLYEQDGPAYPKDGIGDHIVTGSPTVSPESTGTKAALWNRLEVDPGDTTTLTFRLSADGHEPDPAIFDIRKREADEYYGALAADASAEERSILRQALGGLIWSKQFYHYDVDLWLDGDPALPAPPAERLGGRNAAWRHLNNADIIAMPDTWEYPWYAAWDLAFHCVTFAHVDPGFAKHQLLLLCREWYQHPNGQLPAYEWEFGDVNPPVHAWAALRVFEIDGGGDFEFLERIMHKLLLNFTWWVNRKDSLGNNIFEGGFLGMDNIGPIDRSTVPHDLLLEQADGTAWMAMFCLDMLEMALVLAEHDVTYQDLATKFFEHFAYIASAMQHLWSEDDGFYHDQLHLGDAQIPLEVRSMVGLVPLLAVTTLSEPTLDHLTDFSARTDWFLRNKPQYREVVAHVRLQGRDQKRLLSIMSPDRLRAVLSVMLDDAEFLSPFGIRSMSARHREHPYQLQLGETTATVGYEPAESRTELFGGNSNWRGPVWLPVNHLLIDALRTYAGYFGDDELVEFPTGSGVRMTLDQVADELVDRLVGLFSSESGKVPALAADVGYQGFHAIDGRLTFHEYFHGDTGAGLGASHQTGWTALVAELLIRRQTAKPIIARP